tara:strand:+ start:650 stop:2833 length:2184 start_codon:yes stop_codon:yes gene_type:complete
MAKQQNTKQTVASTQPVVRVLVPLSLPKLLDYMYQGAKPPKIGAVVSVQVGTKECHAIVVELPQDAPKRTLKPAILVEDAPHLPAQMVQFFRWAGRYTLSPPGEPWRAAVIGGKIPLQPTPARKLVVTGHAPERLTQARRKVLELAAGKSWQAGALAEFCGVSPSVVQGLVQAGALTLEDQPEQAEPLHFNLKTLNAEQQQAVNTLKKELGQFQVTLLDGVTGSGKTEVYAHILAEVLQQNAGAQVLVLVPEIALTPQLVKRLEEQFGSAPVVWHSHVSPQQRRQAWWRIANGRARVIVGARSALFLPFKNLAYVVVDEEHDASYKQTDSWRYQGRDMAIALAQSWQCPVVLGSATPSLESWHNAHSGRYQFVQLKERYGPALLPSVTTLDMKADGPLGPDQYLSPLLIGALENTLAKGQQALLFLNRRGVAPLLICRSCGHRHDCPRCDASLVAHGTPERGRLTCHHCGFSAPWPKECSLCGSEKLAAYGPGTRKIEQQVKIHFPMARIAVADSDAVASPAQLKELVRQLEEHEIDILIGTQMVTKGHHFPALTLVGVVDADMSLDRGDLRAAEQTFQLMTQVAGRAGRGEKAGHVYLQTHTPDHPLMQALMAHDRDGFYALELAERQKWKFPPFAKLLAVTIQGKNEGAVQQAAQKLAQAYSAQTGEQVLGPAPLPIKRLNHVYRYRVVVKLPKHDHARMVAWLRGVAVPTGVSLILDVDPHNLF